MPKKSLETYQTKRDFSRTSEPSGDEAIQPRDQPQFVIQKHDASNLHYDFRLQVGDILKSWVIPKGPSTDPSVKRLAIPTEDHPMGYIDFEGVIPEGEYGAGTVLVWDTGSYRNLRSEKEGDQASMENAIQEGKIEVWLEGKKINGGVALIRTDSDENERWLFIKMDDDRADAQRNPTSSEPKSVLSNRSPNQIRKDNNS